MRFGGQKAFSINDESSPAYTVSVCKQSSVSDAGKI